MQRSNATQKHATTKPTQPAKTKTIKQAPATQPRKPEHNKDNKDIYKKQTGITTSVMDSEYLARLTRTILVTTFEVIPFLEITTIIFEALKDYTHHLCTLYIKCNYGLRKGNM